MGLPAAPDWRLGAWGPGRPQTRIRPLAPDLAQRLQAFSRGQSVPASALFLRAFHELLGRHLGVDDFALGMPVSLRGSTDWQNEVGYFINLVPLRLESSPDARIGDSLTSAYGCLMDALYHAALPLPRIARAAGRVGQRADDLFCFGFAYQDFISAVGVDKAIDGLRPQVRPHVVQNGDVRFGLAVFETPDGFDLHLNHDLFDEDLPLADAFLDQLQALLDRMAAQPGAVLRGVSLPAPAAATEEPGADGSLNGGESRIPHRRFECQATRAPRQLAVLTDAGAIDYESLEERSGSLAMFLQCDGAMRRGPVAVVMPRGVDAAVAVVGAARAGATVALLDPALPDGVLEARMRTLGPAIVLASASDRERLAGMVVDGVAMLAFDGAWDEIVDLALAMRLSGVTLPRAVQASDLAFVAFTLGASADAGPRAALLEQRTLARVIDVHVQGLGLEPGDRVAAVATGPDSAAWELWSALSSGATWVIPPASVVADATALRRWLAAHQVTIALLGPGAKEAVVSDPPRHLRRAVEGGDPLRGQTAWLAFDRAAGVLLNRVAVVRPSAGAPMQVVDEAGLPVPVGVVGMLVAGGDAVPRAFLSEQRDSVTSVDADIVRSATGGGAWRTGVRARPLPGGRIQVIGAPDRTTAQVAWWKSALEGAPAVLALPTDRPRPAVQRHADGAVPVRLSAELAGQLGRLAAAHDVTLPTTLLTAWAALLSRLSGQHEVVVGMPVADRPRILREELAGYFVNALALRADFGDGATVAQSLRQVRTRSLAVLAYQDAPFDQVVDALQPPRSPSHGPVFQAMFAWQDASRARNKRPLPSMLAQVVWATEARFDVGLSLHEGENGGIEGEVAFDAALFDESTIQRWAEHLETLLEALVERPGELVARLPLLKAEQRQQVLTSFNATSATYPWNKCLHELFEQHVRVASDATALVCGEQRLTYQALNDRANRLAHHLRALGVGPDVLVALCVERSIEMVVGMLAILKAGGAYLPLDPTYPAERIAFMLEDAAPRAVLTTPRLSGSLPAHAGSMATVLLDEAVAGPAAAAPTEDLPVAALGLRPTNLAYCIYTSGSTGRPKGVLIEHGQVVNFIWSAIRDYELGSHDRVLQFSSISFDGAVEEIFSALASGAALVLRDDSVLEGIQALSASCDRHGITVLPLSTAFWARTMAELDNAPDARPRTVRLVLIGGEQAKRSSHDLWIKHFGGRCRLINTYGPTETTVVASRWNAETSEYEGSPPIGRPIANTRMYVLDAHLDPLPVGVIGELYIGGVQVARGYLNRPQLTSERFVEDPFADQAGARMYRTGDLGRWLPDGTLDYVGRNDDQVKIRGFRIETGEIEAALQRLSGVSEAVVAVHGDDENRRLVAYVVPVAGAAAPTGEQMRAHLKTRLPEYMVPSVFIVLPTLPLTPNGKVDRKALPAPEVVGAERALHEPPQGQGEVALAQVWSDLLGVARVSRHDDFFALGGHSLLAAQLVSRVRQTLGRELSVRQVFEASTLAVMAAAIGSPATPAADVVALWPSDGDDGTPRPLSWAQERLWFLHEFDRAASAAYHVVLPLELNGVLDRPRLRAALASCAARHGALRTTFWSDDGVPRMRVLPPTGEVPLVEHDLRGLPAAEREPAARALAHADASRVFALDREWPWRALLVRLEETRYLLTLTQHHIASDGWSQGLMMREIAAFYAPDGQEAATALLPRLALGYADYAVWQRATSGESGWRQRIEYWRQALAGAPALLELPTDRPRPQVQSYAGAQVPVRVDAEVTRRLERLSRRRGATLFMTLLAGWSVLLSRLAGQEEVVSGTPVANRPHPDLEPLIGLFVNTLALRVRVDEQASIGSLLAQVRDICLGAYAHQDVPFEQVVDAVQPARSLGHNPLAQVMFALDNTPLQSVLPMSGLTIRPIEPENDTTQFDLDLTFVQTDDGLSGQLSYATDLFDEATARRWAGQFERLLGQLAGEDGADDLRLLRTVSLVDAGERQRLIEEFNATERPLPADALVHRVIERRVREAPQALAVIDGELRWTRAQLDARARRVARALRQAGVRAEDRVAVCARRSPELIAALLGVWKAGGAYLPLDSDYPAERLTQMLEDAAPRAVLRLGGVPDVVRDWPVAAFDLQALLAEESDEDASPVSWAPDEDAVVEGSPLAYVMYTSGSTGRPKGVMIEHRGLLNYGLDAVRWFELSPESVVLQQNSLNFDLSIEEIVPALLAGAALTPGREPLGAREQPGMATVVHLTAAHWHTLVGEWSDSAARAAVQLRGVRLVNVTGDALSPHKLAQWEALLAAVWSEPSQRPKLINTYGPTEITVSCSAAYVRHAEQGGRVSIGRPFANTRLYVLDGAREPVGIGVVGELWVGGAGVARGYLNRPEQTAERFVRDPFVADPQARMYRTGDLVRWRANGEVEFIGRADFQAKVRGFRVEPGEVEAALARCEGVRDVVVVVHGQDAADKALVAYYVGAVEEAAVAAHARGCLPAHLVPSAFMRLERLPTSPNGKLDRSALPAPNFEPRGAHVPPSTDAERLLATLWEELLAPGRPVSADDNFFALGGHSLMAMRLLSRCRQSGLSMALRDLYQQPTLRALAGAATLTQGDLSEANAATRHRLFCFAPAGASADVYLGWIARLPGIEVIPVELPGHGVRIDEPALRSMDGLASQLAAELLPHAKGTFSLFGHSDGAIVAFEVARRLQALGAVPTWLIAAGRHAPSRVHEVEDDLHALVDAGDAELTAALCAQSPVSKRALEDADFARRYLPAFRADLARIAGYCYREGAPLRANLLLLDGRDELCLDDAQRAAWAREVAGSVQFDALPGDHFFVQTHEPQVLARIRESIDDSAIEARSTATHVFALTSHLHGETTS